MPVMRPRFPFPMLQFPGSEDPNPVSRLCIPVLSMRILDSCSMDPEVLVLWIRMPVMSPGFRFQ
jgi:hypothetical protein